LIRTSGSALCFASSTLIASALAISAFAQSTPDESALTEITVTAQRASQGVLSVPMSVQAETGVQLLDSGIRDLGDLSLVVPGYLANDAAGYTQIFIRGVGNAIFLGADPSVPTYVDDVPRLYATLVNSFIDVDRIEVLKGAQGGLYGRNATGGVVNIVSHQPSTEGYAGDALVDYGEKNTFRAAGWANVPLSQNVAIEFSAERDTHDPYITNHAMGNPYTAADFPGGSSLGTAQQTASTLNSGVMPRNGYANQDLWMVGGKLLVKPSDDFKITIAADYANKQDSLGPQLYNTTPAAVQASVAGFIKELTGANVQLPPGFIQTIGSGSFSTSKGTIDFQNTYDSGISATAVWSLPGFDLTSISAYRAQDVRYSNDLCDCSVPLLTVEQVSSKWFEYQELRAISTGSGPFHWLGGGTYLHNTTESDVLSAVVAPLVPLSIDATVGTVVNNWSVYAQGGYDITSALNLTVSGRYVHETNDTTFGLPVAPAAHLSEDKFLPSATLSYAFEGGGNAYARFAEGFKSGGVNPIAPPSQFVNPSQGAIFGGESVDTYEIGFRAPFDDHRFEFTSAIFYNSYKNLQAAAFPNAQYSYILQAIVNVQSARTFGAEAGLNWRVNGPLTLGFNGGYLDAVYTKYVLANSVELEPFNLSGHVMIDAPRFQLNTTAALDQPINGKFDLVGNIMESWVSTIFWLQSGGPGLPDAVQPGYWITNARLGVATSDKKFGFSVYANNLFNRGYSTYGTSNATTGTTLNWGNPRIVGGEFNVKF
jgi:iron complex outermembrane recepter protein